MTNQEFALSDLAARLAGTDATLSSALRDIVATAIQELIEAELTSVIGAAPGERTPERVTQRNGHRPKLLSTPAGDVEIGIPKLRTGSFFPELLEPRRRIDKALWAVIMTAYITGTSTRKVDDLVKALGCDSGISKSTVSRICAQIDADVAVLRARRLDHPRSTRTLATIGNGAGRSPQVSSMPGSAPNNALAACSRRSATMPKRTNGVETVGAAGRYVARMPEIARCPTLAMGLAVLSPFVDEFSGLDGSLGPFGDGGCPAQAGRR